MAFQNMHFKIYLFISILSSTFLLTVGQEFEETTTCKCGVDTTERIIGGRQADVKKHSWQVSFMSGANFFCGGTLINNNYVLSAAHCFRWYNSNKSLIIEKDISNVIFVFGRSDLYDPKKPESTDSSMQIRIPTEILFHPDHIPQTYYADIILAPLDKPIVEYNNYILPICLPPSDLDIDGEKVTITGWGATASGGGSSSHLQEVDVMVLPGESCLTYGSNYYEELQICAASPGKDACQGDSGGPMVWKQGRQYFQVGVVSFGRGCGDYESPGVYVRVSYFIPWIQEITADEVYCAT